MRDEPGDSFVYANPNRTDAYEPIASKTTTASAPKRIGTKGKNTKRFAEQMVYLGGQAGG